MAELRKVIATREIEDGCGEGEFGWFHGWAPMPVIGELQGIIEWEADGVATTIPADAFRFASNPRGREYNGTETD